MGYKFVKDADEGEIYILPDEKEALKKFLPFFQKTTLKKVLTLKKVTKEI